MMRIISSTWMTMLMLSACTGASETKHIADDSDKDKKDAPQFHTYIFNLDEMKELITFNAWAVANLSSDTSAMTAGNTIALPDTSGIVISMHYPYRGHDYVLYSANIDQDSSMDATYLGEILNGKIVLRDTIVAMGTASMENTPVKIINGVYAYDYFYRVMDRERLLLRSEGSIYIKADTIVVGYRYFDAKK